MRARAAIAAHPPLTGRARRLEQLKTGALLTPREHRGLTKLVEACGAWVADGKECDDRERPFLGMAAEAAGCATAADLVSAACAALAACPAPKPKFTIKLQRGPDDDTAPAAPQKQKPAFSPAASYGGARPGFVFLTGSRGLGYYLEGTEAPPPPAPPLPPPAAAEAPVRYREGSAWNAVNRQASKPIAPDDDDAEFELAAAMEARAAPRKRSAPKPTRPPPPVARANQWAKARPVTKKGAGTAKGRLSSKLGKKRR